MTRRWSWVAGLVVLVGCAAEPEDGDAGADGGASDAAADAAPMEDASVEGCTEARPCDLVAESVRPTVGAVEVGDALLVEWQARNAGSTDFDGYTWSLRLSADGTIDTTDPELCAGRSEAALAAGATDARSATCVVPNDVGSFTLGLIVDVDEEFAESDELNNTRAASSQLTVAPARPDLTLTELACAPSPAPAGATVSCALEVANLGRASAAASTLVLRLSEDAMVDGADPQIGSCLIGTVAGEATLRTSCTGVLPEGAQGPHTVGALVDASSELDERDEDNNLRTASLVVEAAADLFVSQVLCTPNPVDGGTAVSCSVTVGNGGGLAAGAYGAELRISSDAVIDGTDALLATCMGTALPVGASEMLTCMGVVPAALASGSYQFGAIVDPANEVSEANEMNNTGSTMLMVNGGQPDLRVTSVACAPMDAVALGATLSCTLSVENTGVLSSGAFTADLRLSADGVVDATDALLATCVGPDVAPGGSASIVCAGAVDAGTAIADYTVGGRVDTADVVSESDETNNVATTTITVGMADLSVGSVTCTPDPVEPLQEISCRVTVRNLGGRAAGPFDLELLRSDNSSISAGDTLLATCTSTGLAAGGVVDITCPSVVPADTSDGTWYFGVMVDRTNAVREITTTNNVGLDEVIVRRRPDVLVTAMDCPATRLAGENTTCRITFLNQGQAEMPDFTYELRASTNTNITSSDTLIATCPETAIAAGATSLDVCNGRLPSNFQERTYYLGIIADSTAVAEESNESNNNDFSSPVAVMTSPDLITTAVDCPAAVDAGTLISCSVTIRNAGRAAAGAFSYELRMSTNDVITVGDTLVATCSTDGLAGGGMRVVSCSGVVPSGTTGIWYFGGRVDSENVVAEGNETNNSRAADEVTVN